MNSLKSKIAGARKVYETYWDSYTKGDLETFASTLDDRFEMIGTSETEVCHSKADGIAFFKAQMKEVVGKAEMRNRQIEVIPVDQLMLVNEQCDIYVLVDPDLPAGRPYLSVGKQDWNFYSKIRISTFLRETESGWKVFQQHGSLPDMRVQEGETMALEKISKENLELRDAVKRRTAELENKNRELAIEAALEKVRAVAMGMKKPEDMLDVCRVISDQLQEFGVEKIRNVQIAIIDENIGQYLCYQYFTPYDNTTVEKTEYLKSPVEHGMVKQMLASRDGYFIGRLSGKELEDFRIHRKEENHFPDPFLDKATELDYCFLSIGEGGLGLTLYQPMADDILTLFKRFHQVFSLAYQRFRDIQKAEAQAREAQIEAALERVRAQTMAMHSSEDVGKCVVKMFSELTALGVDEGTRFGIGILNHENENNQLWTARKIGEEVSMHIGNIDMAWHPMLKKARQDWLEQVPFQKYVLEGEDLVNYYKMLNKAPHYKIQIPIEKLPKKEIQHCFVFEHGFFYAISPNEFQPELIHITKRFSSLFEQTYRRYLDLVKAEAQAREAEIELALERVRARTMAMQESDELAEVSSILFQQMEALGVSTYSSGFTIWDEDQNELISWMCNADGSMNPPFRMPIDENRWHHDQYIYWKNGKDLAIKDFTGEEMQSYFRYLRSFPLLDEAFEKSIAAGHPMPEKQVHHVANFSHGNLLFITLEPYPKAHELFKRFAKVFEQTYTRFLDLQKAEAQAREAQIELSLERIRSQVTAMQESSDLLDIVVTMRTEFVKLGHEAHYFWHMRWLPERYDKAMTSGDGTKIGMVMTLPRHIHGDIPLVADWEKTKEPTVVLAMEVETAVDYVHKMITLGDFEQVDPQAPTLDDIRHIGGLTFVMARTTHGEIGYSLPGVVTDPPKDAVDTLIRFAGVFDLAYKRFEDLKYAERQHREAQFELALERVRARTMAMQKSEELADAAFVLFEQLRALGGNLWGTGFGLCQEHVEKDEFWFANENGVFPPVAIPNTTDPAHKQMYQGWQKNTDFLSIEKSGAALKSHYDYMLSLPEVRLFFQKIIDEGLSFPEKQQWNAAYFSKGYLLIITLEPYPEPEIFKRFAKVFEQTYTRFLDLQKAEAQAREAEIQLALERVRARSLAMHRSEELADISMELVKQVQTLGMESWFCAFNIYDDDPRGSVEWGSNGQGTFPQYRTPREGVFLRYLEAGQRGETLFVNEIGEEACPAHYEYLCSLPGVGEQLLQMKAAGIPFPTSQIDHVAFFKYGYVLFITYEPAPEAHDIFKRFANVFEQSYTRFLDLQKAEAQAREAKVEAALEKVRARTMGMQSSEELPIAANLLFQEIKAFGMPAWSAGYCTWEEDKKAITAWMSSEGVMQPPFIAPTTEDALFMQMSEAYEEGKSFHVVEMGGEDLVKHYRYMRSLPVVGQILDSIIDAGHPLPSFQIMHYAYFTHGLLLFITYEPVPEAHDIFRRFAKVFEQTYTRFLDLQKAEEQVRESEIQLALERVRARTMAMHSSSELGEVAAVLFEQISTLTNTPDRFNIGIARTEDASIDIWVTDQSGHQITKSFNAKAEKSPIISRLYKGWKDQKKRIVQDIYGEALADWIRYMGSELGIPFDKNLLKAHRYINSVYFSHGFIGITTNEPPMEETLQLIGRFAQVFNQTYTRFLDLQKAEAQAREATKQASLDRVRGVIASMRSAADLELITPLIFKELTILGVPFIRCGVFIIDEKQELINAYLSSPDGNSLGVLKLPYHANELILGTVEAWRKGEVYQQHWNKEDFVQWINIMMQQDQIQDSRTYQGAAVPPESLDLHFVPFTQGMLYVGAISSLDEMELELAKSLAKAFSIAYARYEDFEKLDKAKTEIESAMSELKSTQAQLIQQEKLASLGQLTAGIAHEIKNPLNFVNNFSEVSMEMIEEILEARGERREARSERLETRVKNQEGERDESEEMEDEILEDIKGNLKKIHEHGSRANGIVTSMLQHSRGGSGKMEPTDLNALIKEYVNLSFHGMRAGKNPVDVDIKLDLDDSIGKINLIGEDFSRVILNLCNNAFDAMRTKVQSKDLPGFENLAGLNDYQPKLTVITKPENGQIQIAIQDNGPGIPDEIKDKILQPFFTTKKGTEGTGLGLSITHDIVKAHGGKLEIESGKEGSVFKIILPC